MKKFFDIVYVSVVSVILCGFMIMFFVFPDNDFSPAENRMLNGVPNADIDSILSGSFAEKAGVYIADQFPFRNVFVAAKAYTELGLLRQENNRVIYGKNATLIPRSEDKNSRLGENLDIIERFSDATDADVTVVPIPRTIDVFSEYLPKTYPYEKDMKVWQDLNEGIDNAKLRYIGLYDTLCESNAYYKTDHHYTTHGAYLVYAMLGDSLGYIPEKREFFSVETVTDDFGGTAMRSSGFYLRKRDKIDLFRYENDDSYEILADGKKIELYDFSKLNTADKYAVFLGGNHARVDVCRRALSREKLLIIRDSFADSIAPFLAIHYDLVMIDLRYYTNSVAKILEDEKISKVLIIESISEFSTAKNFSYLLMNQVGKE